MELVSLVFGIGGIEFSAAALDFVTLGAALLMKQLSLLECAVACTRPFTHKPGYDTAQFCMIRFAFCISIIFALLHSGQHVNTCTRSLAFKFVDVFVHLLLSGAAISCIWFVKIWCVYLVQDFALIGPLMSLYKFLLIGRYGFGSGLLAIRAHPFIANPLHI